MTRHFDPAQRHNTWRTDSSHRASNVVGKSLRIGIVIRRSVRNFSTQSRSRDSFTTVPLLSGQLQIAANPLLEGTPLAKIEYLAEDEVLTVRRRLTSSELAIQDFGATEPLRPMLLNSAVARQQVGLGSALKYNTVDQVGATLFYGLIMNHAFENGNKRTALVTLLVFLERNKWVMSGPDEDAIFDFTTSVAAHEFPKIRRAPRLTSDEEVAAIAAWIRTNSRQLTKGDRSMKFSELRRQLEAQGCEFDKPDKNFIKVRRGALSFNTGYPRKNFYVSVTEIKKMRRTLKMDEASGVDSTAFYELEAAVDSFVNEYRQLLDRLAEV